MLTGKLYVYCCMLFWLSSICLAQSHPPVTLTLSGHIDIIGPDTVCEGSSGYMQLTGASSSPKLWQVSTNNGISWSNIANTSNTNTYFMAMNNLCYRAILTNGDTSHTSCLKVDKKSNAGNLSGGGNFCEKGSGNIISTGATGTSLGWYSLTGNTYTSLNNTGSSQTYTNIQETTQYLYICKNGVCPADTKKVTVQVSPLSDAGVLQYSGPVCTGTNSGNIVSTIIKGDVQNWQYFNGTSWINTNVFNNTYSFTNLSANTFYRLIVKSTYCLADTSAPLEVEVNQNSLAGNLSGGGKFCGIPGNGAFHLSGQLGSIVEWQVSSNWGKSWTSITNPSTSLAYNNVLDSLLCRVKIKNGACPEVFSNTDTVLYHAASFAGQLSTAHPQVCEGTNILLTLQQHKGKEIYWQKSTDAGNTWSLFHSGDTSLQLKVMNKQWIKILVKNNFCPTHTSNILEIISKPTPKADIINKDTSVNQGSSFTLLSSGSGSAQWSPPDGIASVNSYITALTPYFSTYYYLTSELDGCFNKDSVFIRVIELEYEGTISNVLTPNGDGINDVLYIQNIEAFRTSELTVFNEYGQLLYQASPYLNNWRGTWNNAPLPDGVYYYVLRFRDKNKIFKGSVTLFSQQ